MQRFKSKEIGYRDVAPILEREACVLCSLLKRFQSSCVLSGKIVRVDRLCSFHIWAVAGGAESDRAARLFTQLLDARELGEEKESERCDICERIMQEESLRCQDFVQLLEDDEFRNWLVGQGALCLPHAARLLPRLSGPDRQLVLALLRKTRERLRDALGAMLTEAGTGQRAPVLLSRVAEFLKGRRGLGRPGSGGRNQSS